MIPRPAGDSLRGIFHQNQPDSKNLSEVFIYSVDFIIETIMNAESPIGWITLGPLTNAALALLKEPRISQRVRMRTMMSGGVNAGNTTPVAEFNVFADPEAARVVFDDHSQRLWFP